MKIHWPRIFALILLVIAILVAISQRAAIGTFLHSITEIGPGHTADERTLGLIAFGIVSVLFVAVLRILTNNHKH